MPKRKPQPRCAKCQALLIFARINGRVTIALDIEPLTEGGTVAVYSPHTGGLVGRWLIKGDAPFSHEKRYRPHQCPKPPKPEPPPALFDVDDVSGAVTSDYAQAQQRYQREVNINPFNPTICP
jgi:hypothetical protein